MSGLALILAAAAAATPPPAASAPPPPVPVATPLAPARAGKLQCYAPDQALKTCGALAGYSFAADGRILNRAEVVVSPTPFTTMTTTAPVTVRGPAVCGLMEGVETATFRIDGKPADAATTAQLRGQVAGGFAAFAGQEVCTRYYPFREGLLATVTVGAVPRPDMTQPVIWVDPGDGYAVKP
jgi:hypothetical protein